MREKDISEVKLAKIIGVDYTTVYRVFKGDRNPGTKFIAGVLKSGLDIEYEEFFLNNPLPDGNKMSKQIA
jgi:transcriptional regulator with XRE-family HTH domain